MLRNDIWMIFRYCSARITQSSTGSHSMLSLGAPWLAAVILRAGLIVMCLGFPAYGQTVTRLESPSGLDQRPRNTTCVAPERPSTDTPIQLTRAFPNLVLPQGNLIALGQAPHDTTRQFAATRLGLLISFQNTPDVRDWRLFLDIQSRVTGIADGAFLNFAFHPNFPADNRVFVLYTATVPGLLPYVARVSSFLSRDSGQTLDSASERVILEIRKPLHQCHNGGMLAFGHDGYLYISTGDGDNCQPRYAQDLFSLQGKVLRLDVDGATPYATPPDNPFAQGGGLPEIYAWGLRNPFRGNFDPTTGQLWLGDVGEGGFEEINLIRNGKNYVWPIMEGKSCWPLGTTCTMEGLELPVVELDRRGLSPFWVVGGYVYRGTAVPALVGTYIFAEGWSGTLYALVYDQQGHPLPKVLLETGRVIYSLAQDAAGEIYVVNLRTIDQITPAGPGTPSTFPTVLSQTGCVDPADTSEPASGLIPYDVNTPLWSDGAAKQRWMALPEGGQVHINPDGDWDYPLGTVLVKSFHLGEQLVETRLFMRHSDGEWAGYSYEWNAQQTDATLVPSGGKVQEVNGQTWTYPSRAACLLCHTTAAGRTLGLETAQMNRAMVYPTTGRTANQMTTLAHIGVFDPASTAGVPADPRRLPALAALHDASKSVDQRARSYLHANCAFCHRPDGDGRGPEDFRFHLPGPQIHALDVIPTLGNLGVPEARLIAPGAPEKSIISLRMHAVSDVRMPPVASRLVDPEGTAMVDRWIRSLLWFDLNGDGAVDPRDVALLQQAVGTQNPKADLNGDGAVNSLDVGLVRRLLEHLVDYPLDGTAEDASGQGHDGVVQGAVPTADRFGAREKAYGFNGLDSQITVATLPEALSGDFSFTYWMQSTDSRRMHAVSLGESVGTNLDFNFNDSPYGLWVSWNGLGTHSIPTPGLPAGSLTDGQWHHIVLQRTGTRVELYVDGRLEGSTTYAGVIGTVGPLRLGRGSYNTLWWHGALDEVRVYRRALSVREIAALSQDTLGHTKLLAYYPLDGTAEDASGRGQHGVVNKALLAPDRFEEKERAYRFVGLDSFITVATLPEAFSGDFSLTYWMQSSVTTRMHALSLGNRSGANLDFDFNDTSYGLWVYWNSSGEHGIRTTGLPSGSLTDGQWHHIGLRRAGSRVELYIDGRLHGATEYQGVIGVPGPLLLGQGSHVTRWWNGALDEVLVYGRALSATEIAALSTDHPVLRLGALNRGKALHTGAVYDITWVAEPGVISVRLDYSIDDGITWQEISAATPAALGRYAWTVPAIATRMARSRIRNALDDHDAFVGKPFLVVQGRQLWELVTEHASFAPRDGAGPLVFQNKMWLIGGWNPDDTSVANSVWSSSDGRNWQLVVAHTPWSGAHRAGFVVYDDKMWIINSSEETGVWWSADGITWTRVLENAPWGQRYKPYVLVYDNKIWLMGGLNIYDGNSVPYNDVWNSTDGVHWRKVIDHAAWAPRGAIHGTVVFQGKMWILGGGVYPPLPANDRRQEISYHDVWNSTNGIDWHLVTSAAPWLPRLHHNVTVYADKIWVMAGHDYGIFNTGLKNDVWISSNGEDWYELPGTPWSERHAAHAFVYDETLWFVAGYLVNDVWKLRLPGNLAINNDDIYTQDNSVTLTITAPRNDVESIQLSNDGVVWSAPEAYTTTRTWTLAQGDGYKTVYVRFRDTHGIWSEIYEDHIILNLRLLTPNGHESLLVGSVYDITWRAERHITAVKLAYSMDDGITWHEIAAATPASVGRYTWTVPDISSRLCRIKLSDAADSRVFMVSAEVFSVLHATDGLVAYYPFDGNAQDTSGNANHGVVHGAVLTVDRFGAAQSAYSFAGLDFIAVEELPVVFDADFSMAYWVHTSATSRMHALSLGDSVGSNVDFDFNDATYGLGVYWNGNGALGIWPATIPIGALTDGTWHHLVLRRVGAQVSLYVDGALTGSATYLGVIGEPSLLRIGRGSYVTLGWRGVIDDVRIYDRALGDDEIMALSTDNFR